MKIYAKQVPPEYQESPLFMFGEWPENVYVFGNNHYNQHAKRLDEIRAALQDLADEWDRLHDGGGYYASWIEALNDILPPDTTRSEYTRAERMLLAKLAAQIEWCNSTVEYGILRDVLCVITGRGWVYETIRGCCQGDWQEIIYPAEYGRDWLEAFETEYFNTGTEWIIDPDGDACSMYAHGWNDDTIRAEIADAAGVNPGDVVLLKFNGWSRTATYEEVSA